MVDNCLSQDIGNIHAIVIVLFGFIMSWIGHHLGYEKGKTDEYKRIIIKESEHLS